MAQDKYPKVIDASVGMGTHGTIAGVSGGSSDHTREPHQEISDRILALETKVGADGSNDPASLDYQLRQLVSVSDAVTGATGDEVSLVFALNASETLIDAVQPASGDEVSLIIPVVTGDEVSLVYLS